MFRSTLLSFLIICFVALDQAISQKVISKDDYTFSFTDIIPCTEIEDQENTGTCWSFSTGSFLESEALRLGKKAIDLSEMFWVRKAYLEKAAKYLRYHGKSNFGPGGLGHDILRLYERYGAMPEEVYNGLLPGKQKHNHAKLQKELVSYLDSLIKSGSIEPNWNADLAEILDAHLGPCPDSFSYMGKDYDPKSFAFDYIGINSEDYLTITSFLHHPLYAMFVLEVPDNYSDGVYLNVTLDDLQDIINRAFSLGHTIVWDCDVSETGFSARQGLAIVPDEDLQAGLDPFYGPHHEAKIDASMRQLEFDSHSLTDDHLMHIVGRAQDQSGASYYYVKNSWGPGPGFEGYLFASEAYLLLNTIGITVHKDAIGKQVWQKAEEVHGQTDD